MHLTEYALSQIIRQTALYYDGHTIFAYHRKLWVASVAFSLHLLTSFLFDGDVFTYRSFSSKFLPISLLHSNGSNVISFPAYITYMLQIFFA